MSRRRFFVPPEQVCRGIAQLQPDQAHHLRHVLRLRAGTEVEIFDGTGRDYTGVIEFGGGVARIVALHELEVRGCDGPILTLAVALIKSDRFELVLQKATELGVDAFVPLLTRHCKARLPALKIAPRLDRWKSIIREACKQCRRSTIPEIRAPLEFERWLDDDAYRGYERYLLHAEAPQPPLVPPPAGRIILCIGPEGGWHEAEVAAAEKGGWKIFRLGDRIMRAETAAIAAAALFRFGPAMFAAHRK